jgi:hypothetical protein
MRGVLYWFFILLLPVFAVLGHDIYHAYNSKQGIDLSQPFPFSEVGWLWVNYQYDSYSWAHSNIDNNVWKDLVAPFLKQKAVLAALVPAFLAFVLLLVMKFLGVGPYHGQGVIRWKKIPGTKKKRKGSYTFTDGPTKKKTKYRRK